MDDEASLEGEDLYDEIDDLDTTEKEALIDQLQESLRSHRGKVLPTWAYLCIFTLPAAVTFFILKYEDIALTLETAIIVTITMGTMNASINSVIAWMTIRLDGHSNEALEHLETIMSEMDRLENTLDTASEMVTSFTGDLEEAKAMFTKVGVDVSELDLEPVADVVEKLKENKDGLIDVLDNMKGIDFDLYITKAKGIDWDALLDAATRAAPTLPDVSSFTPPTLDRGIIDTPEEADLPDDEELDSFFVDEWSSPPETVLLQPLPQPTLARSSRKPLTLKRRR